MAFKKALFKSKRVPELVHYHLLACKILIALDHFDAMPYFKREEDSKEEVKPNQEIPKEVMQLHDICSHEKCAMAQVSAPQDFCCSCSLVRIKEKSQCSPALNNTR